MPRSPSECEPRDRIGRAAAGACRERCDDAHVEPTPRGPDTAGRSPGRMPDGEPDYRMSLAAERTFLAYVRTALALLAVGVAVVGALPDAGHLEVRRLLGAMLVFLGLFVAVEARRRFRSVDRAMRRGDPLPRTPLVNAVVLVAAAVLALVRVLLL